MYRALVHLRLMSFSQDGRNQNDITTSEELNILKSSNTTFYTFTPCILLQGSPKR